MQYQCSSDSVFQNNFELGKYLLCPPTLGRKIQSDGQDENLGFNLTLNLTEGQLYILSIKILGVWIDQYSILMEF